MITSRLSRDRSYKSYGWLIGLCKSKGLRYTSDDGVNEKLLRVRLYFRKRTITYTM